MIYSAIRHRQVARDALPPTRKQLLDAARRDALFLAFGGHGGHQPSCASGHDDGGSHRAANRWYCVQSHAGQEARAAVELRQQNFQSFVPAMICQRRRHFVARPALPRYLFVAFDADIAPWRRICSTRGVARLFLLNDCTPAPARRGEVEGLMELVAEQLGRPDPLRAAARIGGIGHVAAGPLAGFRCTVVESAADGKLRVNLEIFGRPSCITLERDAIRLDGD